MKIFISYHRKDSYYRHKLENILTSKNIEYYAVPEDADFTGKKHESICHFICNRLKECDVLLCLIGEETYKRPHVDREIHTALKGRPGKRLGIIGILLPTRKDSLNYIDLNTFPTKLWENKEYVIWENWNKLNSQIATLISSAANNAKNPSLQTNHTNPCMKLRSTFYYDS